MACLPTTKLIEDNKRPGLAHARPMGNVEKRARANTKRQAFLVANQQLSPGHSEIRWQNPG